MKASIFEYPFNQLTEKYFKHLKTKNFLNKGVFAARVNLVTQVAEVANFSFWLRKFRIGTEAQEKIVSLLCCCASRGTSQHLSKVVRENSCVYSLFFRIYFLFLWASAWITTWVFFLNNLFNFSNTSSCCSWYEVFASSIKFYLLLPDKENTDK